MPQLTAYYAALFLFLLFVNLCRGSEIQNEKSPAYTDLIANYDQGPCWNGFCIEVSTYMTRINYSYAEYYCRELENGHLIIIDSIEKQQFLEEYLKTKSLGDKGFWIGLKYLKDEKIYRWPFNRPLEYSNWEKGYPKNDAKYCVEFKTSTSDFGKWSERLCDKETNFLLCEKVEKKWSAEELQTRIIFLMKDLSNTVPVGFTYVQLPKEKPPNEIWPLYKWENISPNYAGLFFRTEGGNASAFGTIQNDNTRRFYWASRGYLEENDHHESSVYLKENGFFPPLHIGGTSTGNSYIKFGVGVGEVRPQNMAMKIWKRVQ